MYIFGFFNSYNGFDFFGKSIFWFLIFLSIVSWVVMIYKIKIIKMAKKDSLNFENIFVKEKLFSIKDFKENPLFQIYKNVKQRTFQILDKNSFFYEKKVFLSKEDIDLLKEDINIAIAKECKFLEKNVFVIPIIITLAPFLGLLGTVWGILITFSSLEISHNINQSVLSGISMALSTTILGLVVAIPSIIGYGYLKNLIREFVFDMQNFSNKMISSLEMQYRKVLK